MITIWKYRIEPVDTEVSIHGKPVSFEGPQILHAAWQSVELNEPLPSLFVWAMVDTDQPEAVLSFRALATGRSLRGMKSYRLVATTIEATTHEVWHVFVAGES